MILTDLLGLTALDSSGRRVGTVIDVRFVLDDQPEGEPVTARLHGFVVSPRSRSSYLGYERKSASSPALINIFLAWRHRGTFLVSWAGMEQFSPDALRLRPDYVREDPRLSR